MPRGPGCNRCIGALTFTILFNRLADVDVDGDVVLRLRARRLHRVDLLLDGRVLRHDQPAGQRRSADQGGVPADRRPGRRIAAADWSTSPSGSRHDVVVSVVVGDGLSPRPVARGCPLGVLLLLLAAARPGAVLQRVDRAVPGRGGARRLRPAVPPLRQPGRLPAEARARGAGASSTTSTRWPGRLGLLRAGARRHRCRRAGHLALSCARRRRAPASPSASSTSARNERSFADII